MKNLSINNNFDILRLILAILVFFAHWNILTSQDISNPLFHLSGFAVDMFFIVSGFLIFWSFDADQNKKHFYIKRFFRIFPLYAFLILLQTLFFIGFSDGNTLEIIKYFLVNIFFLNFLAPSVGTTLSALQVDAINGSLWTLKNEVVFYAFVPFIFMLYKKWGGGRYFLVMLYSLSVIYMFGVEYLGISKLLVQFPAQLRLFVVGILLYVMFDKFRNKNITLWVIGSVGLIVLFGEYEYFKFSLYPLLLGIVVIWLAYFVKHIKIDFDFSYSFYILHFPVIQLSLYFGVNPTNPMVSFVSLFGVVWVLSYFSEKYIEKSFVKIGKEIVKGERLK
jgi:peptidoglycan/LPS O-acetylase OafA/YrhL